MSLAKAGGTNDGHGRQTRTYVSSSPTSTTQPLGHVTSCSTSNAPACRLADQPFGIFDCLGAFDDFGPARGVADGGSCPTASPRRSIEALVRLHRIRKGITVVFTLGNGPVERVFLADILLYLVAGHVDGDVLMARAK